MMMPMPLWLRIIFGFWGGIQLALVTWLLLGVTSGFHRMPDLKGTVGLGMQGVPLLLLSVWCLSVGFGRPRYTKSKLTVPLVILVFSILLSGIVWHTAKRIGTEGWLSVRVDSNMLKITEDDRYVYQLEIVNRYQNNEHVRLFVEKRIGAREKYIELDLSRNEMSDLLDSGYDWVELTPKQGNYRYTLSPTDEVDGADWEFEVNLADWTAKRTK